MQRGECKGKKKKERDKGVKTEKVTKKDTWIKGGNKVGGQRNREPEGKIVTKTRTGRALLILWPVCVTSTLLGRQMCR